MGVSQADPADYAVIGGPTGFKGRGDIQRARRGGPVIGPRAVSRAKEARLEFGIFEGLLNAGQDTDAWRIKGKIVENRIMDGPGNIRLKYNIQGTGFELKCPRRPDYGRARIWIDGIFAGCADLRADAEIAPEAVYMVRGLVNTRHGIVIEPEEGTIAVESLTAYSFVIG